MRKTGPNMPARVLAAIRAQAKHDRQPVLLLQVRYVLERFLERLSRSPYRDQLILKGGMLMMAWHDIPHRATRDLDFLGLMRLDVDEVRSTLREIFAIEGDDVVRFDADVLTLTPIRETAAYPGLRASTIAFIGKAETKVVIDIGIGDSTEPGIVDVEYPTLLGAPPPRVRGYARETVIAEKFEAIVRNGLGNSRMKDFYDLWRIFTSPSVMDEQRLARAIASTFERRHTELPMETPIGLTTSFVQDDDLYHHESRGAFFRLRSRSHVPSSVVGQ